VLSRETNFSAVAVYRCGLAYFNYGGYLAYYFNIIVRTRTKASALRLISGDFDAGGIVCCFCSARIIFDRAAVDLSLFFNRAESFLNNIWFLFTSVQYRTMYLRATGIFDRLARYFAARVACALQRRSA